ncbi:tetratricopeptide repeat protein [Streptomyces cyaneus]|uniref:tetratricopeptide repeat protein n=1 Tax=Streptomyces cyaneus TaxID=1904 RepID=UPI000FF8A767|nr:tetratricopeptide repeat protein [Streptomyces cyaneus]
MGGIGKTALAVEAAHRACAEGWFPGGTLFVDLRGYDDDPVTADQAVLALLDAMGVQGAELPQAVARQYDAYRRLLSERQNRTLLILDNASDPSQFLSLLPGTDHHRVLITSRDRPDALPIRLIDLETLAGDDSAALVTRALRAADERDDRPAREPQALHELAELCGHLPLALQIAAAMLRRRRRRDIASLVAEIKRVGDTLAVLDHGSRGADQYGRSLTLRPVLETSYRRLPPEQARLLRLLALAPGAETGTEAVAALTGLDMDVAVGLLEDVGAAGLLTVVQSGGGVRWRLHDLVRAFGMGVVAADTVFREEGETARERVLEFYHQWAASADDRLNWVPGMPQPERFTSRAQALAWLDSERAGLVAAVQWTREDRHTHNGVRLAVRLVRYLDWRRYHDEWIAVARTAQEAAHRAGDRLGEANACDRLGTALLKVGRVEEAIDAHMRSRDLFQAAEDLHGEAIAWESLGVALEEAGRIEEAIDADIHARVLFRATDNRRGEGNTWNHLGSALHAAGQVWEAIDAFTHARDLYQAVEDRNREGIAWNNLGVALAEAGRFEEAIEAFANASDSHRDFEDWYRAGGALYNLALGHQTVGHPDEARAYYLQAAHAYTQANAPTEAAHAQFAADALT